MSTTSGSHMQTAAMCQHSTIEKSLSLLVCFGHEQTAYDREPSPVEAVGLPVFESPGESRLQNLDRFLIQDILMKDQCIFLEVNLQKFIQMY